MFTVEGSPCNDTCWRVSVRGDWADVAPGGDDITVDEFSMVDDVKQQLSVF